MGTARHHHGFEDDGRMPSEIKIPHARQVGLYASSDNMDARLTYVTPKKCQTYRLENVREHREALHQIAKRVENFLALSDDPAIFPRHHRAGPRQFLLDDAGGAATRIRALESILKFPATDGHGALRADRSIWRRIANG